MQVTIKTLITTATALALGTVSLASVAGEDLLAAMKDKGGATAAIASAPPWAFVTPSGDAGGYLVDVTNLALEGMGAPKIAPVLTTFDAMIPGLQSGRFDVLPGGLLITEQRCKAVAMSDPVTAQQDALYVLPGNPKHLTGYAQAAKTGSAKVAVVTGSLQEIYAMKSGFTSDNLVKVPDIQAGIATVLGGRADAFIVGQFSVPDPKQKGVEVVVDRDAPVMSIAILFRKEDAKFRDQFNKQLEKLRANGAMQKLYADKYKISNWDVLAKTTKISQLATGCN